MSMYENIGMTSLDYIEEILHLRKALAEISDECSKAYDKIANLEQQRWVSIKDRMPEKSVPVLICAAGHRVTAYYDKVKEVFRLTEDDNLYYLTKCVTHWMPLPEPPESEGEICIVG